LVEIEFLLQPLLARLRILEQMLVTRPIPTPAAKLIPTPAAKLIPTPEARPMRSET
jgi:hypothetical protein